jgi:hypothetical protein
MSTSAAGDPPLWFRITALVALVWNAFGLVMFLSSVGAFGDPTEGLTDAERAFAENMPLWITAAFGVGTFTGVAGSLGLLLRRRWAWPLLLVSAIALLLLEGWILFVSGAVALFGMAIPIAVSVGALLLVWLARYAGQRGWLR